MEALRQKKESPSKIVSVATPKKAKQFAVIRMCGCVKLRSDFEDTLRMLNMSRKFMCVVLDATPSVLGMVRKVKDYVTWGEVTPEVVITLQQKRGEKIKDREGKEVLKPFFRLHPPRGGFERKGMKVHFRQHGALGYRGTQINDLIKRMI